MNKRSRQSQSKLLEYSRLNAAAGGGGASGGGSGSGLEFGSKYLCQIIGQGQAGVYDVIILQSDLNARFVTNPLQFYTDGEKVEGMFVIERDMQIIFHDPDYLL